MNQFFSSVLSILLVVANSYSHISSKPSDYCITCLKFIFYHHESIYILWVSLLSSLLPCDLCHVWWARGSLGFRAEESGLPLAVPIGVVVEGRIARRGHHWADWWRRQRHMCVPPLRAIASSWGWRQRFRGQRRGGGAFLGAMWREAWRVRWFTSSACVNWGPFITKHIIMVTYGWAVVWAWCSQLYGDSVSEMGLGIARFVQTGNLVTGK